MTADGKISRLPISEIHSETGAQDLVQSEKMKPYLAFLKALMGGQDIRNDLRCRFRCYIRDNETGSAGSLRRSKTAVSRSN